jgi:hypothetical protein
MENAQIREGKICQEGHGVNQSGLQVYLSISPIDQFLGDGGNMMALEAGQIELLLGRLA